MALQFLNPQILGTLLSCTWQNYLGTSEDPANGQWYTDGANGDGIGLYGGLSDSLPGQVQLDAGAAVVATKQIVADTAIAGNPGGFTPSPMVQLSYGYAASVQNTYSTIPCVAQGTPFSIPMHEVLAQGGATVDLVFTFSSPATAGPITEPRQFSRALQVSVPQGCVYQVVLAAETQQVSVPYTAEIIVTGTTETWFANPVNGHYNWKADVGAAFQRIVQYACDGPNSAAYAGAANGTGTLTLKGTLNVSQVGSFTALVYDVTAQVRPGSFPTAPAPGSAPPSAPVVQRMPL